jgi:hypothetical protein
MQTSADWRKCAAVGKQYNALVLRMWRGIRARLRRYPWWAGVKALLVAQRRRGTAGGTHGKNPEKQGPWYRRHFYPERDFAVLGISGISDGQDRCQQLDGCMIAATTGKWPPEGRFALRGPGWSSKLFVRVCVKCV